MRVDVAMPQEVFVAPEKAKMSGSLVTLQEISDYQSGNPAISDDIKNILGDAPQFYDSSKESALPPEARFQALAENITSAEDYADKRDDMVDLITEQQRLTDQAKTDFEEHPALEILLPQSQQEKDKVLEAVRLSNPELLKNPSFMKLLYELPSAVYSNNPEASTVFAALMDVLDRNGQNALVDYADKILNLSIANPSLIEAYRKSHEKYADETGTEDMMWRILYDLDDRFTKEG